MAGEKTEKATPKKRREAREKGQVALRAAAQATSGLPNTTISSSPIVLTTFPSHFATTARSSPRQASIALAAGLSPSFS